MSVFIDHVLAGFQYLLPHHLVTRAAHGLANCKIAWFKNLMIRIFARIFKINWSEAAAQTPNDYKNFNAFFTRALAPGARKIAADSNLVVSPVDGTVSACGPVEGSKIFQAKGHDYSLEALLADKSQAALFRDGQFATIYLSPKDYHRIHMPVSGELESMAHVPGRLFSVAPYTVRCIPGLFARNERSIHLFKTRHGPLALAMIGAMVVGSMETVWHGVINPPRGRELRIKHYEGESRPAALGRGDEMGRFNMGSTVILLFPAHALEWLPEFSAGASVQVGQPIAKILPAEPSDSSL